MNTLLAFWNQPMSAWSPIDWIVFAIVVVVALGVLFVVCRVAEINIPPWVWHILAILGAGLLAIWAIRLIAS